MRILIVDDSLTMRRIIKNVVSQLGFQDIDEAENGAVAYFKANERQYDLILTDWNMPIMNGLDFVLRMRSLPEYKVTPIIMVTTEGGKSEVVTALKAGVNNYVVKPFSAETLKEKIDSVRK